MSSIAERRNALLARFPEWPDLTIAGLFDYAAARFPDRELVVTAERRVTYAEAQDVSRALAAGLIAHGLQPGDRVALVMANLPEFVLAKLAIARAGAIAVPVNIQLRRDELRYVVEQSGASCLIGMDRFRERDYIADFLDLQQTLPALGQVFVHSSGRPAAQPDLVELAAAASPDARDELARREAAANGAALSDIVYTSGTTGQPKGAMLTHDMVLRAAFSSALTRSFEDGRRIQFALPLYHVFGYVECWIAALFVGGAIIPQAQFDAADMLDRAVELGATDMVCVPMMTQALIAAARSSDFACPSLRAVFNSGGANLPGVWEDIRTVLGATEIHTAYGMTETTASAMCTWTEDGDRYLLGSNGRIKAAGPAGDPALGGVVAEYRVADPLTGAVLAPGEEGELQVRGPIVTRGYHGKPEETAAAFTADGWFRSGDLGRLLDGGYLKLTGRIKETYRCGGEMVMPREIEELLADWPGLAQVHAVGVPDTRMGEVGCLCVVLQPDATADPDALLAHCAERLARFKVPRHVIVLRSEDIPLTVTGRPQKFLLARLAAERV